MYTSYDIKNKIAGFGFLQLKLTAQPVNCAKLFLKTFGPVGDSFAE